MTETVSLTAIPHRPPFLFVDEVVELTDARIVTSLFVDPKLDFFRGHYPGEPIMPGVLICEACFQAGALLVAHRVGSGAIDGVPVLTRITDARFKRIVRPGDSLMIETTLDEELGGAYFMTGRASVGGKAAVRVAFATMLVSPNGGAA